MLDSPLHTPPFLSCQHCGSPLAVYQPPTIEYFEGKKGICTNEKCTCGIDWWDCVLSSLKQRFMFAPFAGLGAMTTIFNITLRAETRYSMSFADHEIPSTAKILTINYTSQGGNLIATECHSNTPMRHFIPNTILLWPRPLSSPPDRETVVNVAVTWVPVTENDMAWQNIVEAFEAFYIKRLSSTIIPANVAIESTLTQLLTESFVARGISRKSVEDCLGDGATYSHQLNVLLPALVSFIGAPDLQDHIRGQLNRLRKLRNEMAHHGKLLTALTDGEAAECLCAALFAFHYFRLVREYVEGARPPLDKTKSDGH